MWSGLTATRWYRSQEVRSLNRPGKCGGSRPWKRGWSHAEGTGAWKADLASGYFAAAFSATGSGETVAGDFFGADLRACACSRLVSRRLADCCCLGAVISSSPGCALCAAVRCSTVAWLTRRFNPQRTLASVDMAVRLGISLLLANPRQTRSMPGKLIRIIGGIKLPSHQVFAGQRTTYAPIYGCVNG
jgi:hypothetical protein